MPKIKVTKKLQKTIDQSIVKYGKLPKQFKKDWVKGLRSGKYIQGQEYLKSLNDDGKTTYCCLGVACHVAGASGILNKEMIKNDTYNNNIIKSINKVPKLLHYESDLSLELANFNDLKKHSFNDIADFIEEYL